MTVPDPEDGLELGEEPPKSLGKASFSVSSRVALQLGRESISSSITAIVELVKNAYDADAEVVRIRFARLGSPDAFMIIEDTGEGMTVDELKNNWMVIGTANKTERRKTTKQRTVTGEKGLGRLGLDRLCTRTEVESIKLGSTQGVRLEVQWDRYEGNEARLEAVEHDLYSIRGFTLDPITRLHSDAKKGTRLILRSLKDDWDEDSITQLRNELGLVLSPFQGLNDFSIEIDTGKVWEGLDGPVTIRKPLLDAANWKVVATLDEEDQIEIEMMSSRHDTEFHFKPTLWKEAIKKGGSKPACGPLRMEFYLFVRRDVELAEKTILAGEITSFLKFNQGIRIYRDGFRVKPYGEPDGTGDWLRLAFRRMQNPEGVTQDKKPGNWRIGYNQIVGAVFITHEKNSGLNDQTNREGLLQGPAFDHLHTFALRVIQYFEIHHQTYEMAQKVVNTPVEKAEEKARSSIEGANEAIKDLRELTERLPNLVAKGNEQPPGKPPSEEITKVMGEVQRKLEIASTGLQESQKLRQDAEEQKNTMSNLASLGILAAAFGHETLDWTGTIVKNTDWLLTELSEEKFMMNPEEQHNIITSLQDASAEAIKVRKFARFTIGNLNRDKRQRDTFDLSKTVKRVFDAFDEVLRIQRNTSIDLDGLPLSPCYIEGYEMDWESIVVNLITNSNWALEDKLSSERKIKVALHDRDTKWLLAFNDSGVGLEAGTEKLIFLPAFTTKRSKRGVTIGTGMGLFIVKSFVEEHSRGTINVLSRGELGGASFQIEIPKAELKQQSKTKS